MKEKGSAVNFGGWGWFLIVICIFYQMMFSAFAVDGINGYGMSLAKRLSDLSGTTISSDVLVAVLTPVGIVCCLLGVFFANLVYKKGAKAVGVAACFGMSAAVFAFGFINSLPSYILGVFVVQAFGTCLAFSVHHGLIGQWFPTRKGVVMGWTTMGLPLSSMVLLPFVTWCMTDGIGWAGFCNTLAIILLILGLVTLLLVSNTPEEKGKYPDNIKPDDAKKHEKRGDILRFFRSRYTVKELLKNRSVWMICVGFGIPWATTVGAMSQLINRMMSTGYFNNPMVPVAIMSGSTAVGLVGSFFWGWLDTRIGTKKAGIFYNLAYVVLLIALIFLHRLPVVMCTVVTSALCFTAGGIANLMPSMVISKFGRYEFLSANRVCTPLSTIIQSFGFAILALGKMATGGSWVGGYSVFIVACIIGAFIIHRIDDTSEVNDKEIEQELLRLAAEQQKK